MFTYQRLDFIADSYIPVLFFISLFIFAVDIFRNGFKKHCLQLGSVVLSVLIVYLVMAVDNRFEIWPKFDLDYSTHTALALVFVIFLSSRGTLALTLSVLSFVLYIALMRLFAFKGVEKIWPAGKGVGDLRKCKLSHQQKLSPRREQSYLF